VIEACMREIGVWVEPGPTAPARSPAITRTRAPASGEAIKATSAASRGW
jgi:hypothetical protein